jgi:citrate lyase beta subunit
VTSATRPRRTLLFAPGNRPEVHAKALASGADVVCLDLEDAVPPHAKEEARRLSVPFLSDAPGPERVVRINSVRCAEGLRDLLAIVDARPKAGVIFLPKVATPQEVLLVEEILAEASLPLSIAVLIESLQGLENVAAILSATSRIAFAMFGGADLSAELGVEIAHEPLLYARSRIVHAARLAGVDIFDVPSLNFRDLDAVGAEALAAKKLGFSGKGLIHPSNVATVAAIFSPRHDEVARAEAIIAAYAASPNGLAVVEGKLIEKPVVRAMQRVLALREFALPN